MSDTERLTALCETGEHEKCLTKVCGCSCHVFARKAAKERIREMRELLKGDK